MSGSRARQALALLLIGLSLWATLHFGRVYAAQRLWLGLCATVALGLLLLCGAASFSQARRRLHKELVALALAEGGGTPAPETLANQRRLELEALKARGGRADLGALAARSAADVAEAAGAPLGRYFVGVAVLVGLLGTFAGLMETLGSVASLLGQDQDHPMQSLLQLLTAPLAGLNVTFGASMVGILVTVTLALFAGDLSLLDEQVLARLESYCAHQVVPALWPVSEEPAARLLREVSGLREGLRVELTTALSAGSKLLDEALARAERQQQQAAELVAQQQARAEQQQQRAAEQAAQQQARAEQQQQQAAEQAAQQQARLADSLAGHQQALQTQAEASLRAHLDRSLELLEGLMSRLAEAEGARAQQREGQHGERLRAFLAELAAQQGRLHEALAAAEDQGALRLQEAVRAVEGYAASLVQVEAARAAALEAAEGRRQAGHEDLLGQMRALLRDGIAAPVGAWQDAAREARGAAERLCAEAQILKEAAAEFAQAGAAVGPALGALAPELSALSAELALLVERVPVAPGVAEAAPAQEAEHLR